LQLLREIDELLELPVDEIRVAGDAAAQRFAELAYGAQLFLAQALRAQLVAERQQLGRGGVELLLHVLDATRVVPVTAIARVPDAPAAPVVAVAARTEPAVAIADLAAAIRVRLRVALPTGLALLALLALLTLLLTGLPLLRLLALARLLTVLRLPRLL